MGCFSSKPNRPIQVAQRPQTPDVKDIPDTIQSNVKPKGKKRKSGFCAMGPAEDDTGWERGRDGII